MSYRVPDEYDPQIEEIAKTQHISAVEAVDRVIRAGIDRLAPPGSDAPVSNVALFGSVTGRGAHGSKEAIDRYLAELRSEW